VADLRMKAGEDDAARRSFHEAIATARTAEEVARAYVAFYWLPYRHGDFEAALAILEEGLAVLPDDAAAARAHVQTAIGWCLVRLRRLDDALISLEEALDVLEASGDRLGAMRALDFLGVLLRYLGRPDEGIDRLDRSLALARELTDSDGELFAQVHLAAALTRSGHPVRARSHADRSLELAALKGDRYSEAVAAWGAAEMQEVLGDRAAAVAYRHRELSLLAAIGGNPHNEALAHAHLAHLARREGDPTGFAREAETALALARSSDDTDYPARIQAALEAESWSRLES
jgi:tetratricopeptide (TPR) repeat protein